MIRCGEFWVPQENDRANDKIRDGMAEQIEALHFALKHVTDKRMAIDGGAHVGVWTRIMAKNFNRVLAFEPQRPLWDCLFENTKGLYNVERFCGALGEKYGTCEPQYKPNASFSSRVKFDPKGVGERTPVLSIDGLRLPSVGLIKLDVEGSEYEALRGAEETIRRDHPVLILEYKHWGAKKKDGQPYQKEWIESFLSECGYRIVWKRRPDRVYI